MVSFDSDAFRAALSGLEINLGKAQKELDKCRNNGDEVAYVYGKGPLRNSALFQLIHHSRSSKDDVDKIHALLEHPVMRRVIMLKWEKFGRRVYTQQLFAYILLLMCMTLSATFRTIDDSFDVQLKIWLFLGSALVISLGGMYLGTKERDIVIVFSFIVGAWTCFYSTYNIIAHYLTLELVIRWNGLCLLSLGLYFFRIEVLEFIGESRKDVMEFQALPSWINLMYFYIDNFPVQCFAKLFGHNKSTYLDSYINLIQHPTFVGVAIYGCWQFLVPTINDVSQIVNLMLTFFLWVLSIQYLEANTSAAYLIPMMAGMFDQVINFMLFYAPFQCGYTMAYFVLFHNANTDKYSSLPQSFTTTFLVLLGQIDLEPFNSLESTILYIIGYALLASNGFIVMVLQLNMLIAMMNNAFEENKNKAKRHALVSLAAFVLRIEKIQGIEELKKIDDLKRMGNTELEQFEYFYGESYNDERNDLSEKRMEKLENDVARILQLLEAQQEKITQSHI